jgi:hypothetical protein
MAQRISWYLVCLIGIYPTVAAGQAPDRSEENSANNSSAAPKPYDCDPICGPGMVCTEGKCVSPCNPPCPADKVCAGFGKCVPAPVCDPQCRSGYTCVDGRCVSACNPVCGKYETCTENGECVRVVEEQPRTVWVWHDRYPYWHWYAPGAYLWWNPGPVWHHPRPNRFRPDNPRHDRRRR